MCQIILFLMFYYVVKEVEYMNFKLHFLQFYSRAAAVFVHINKTFERSSYTDCLTDFRLPKIGEVLYFFP